MIGSFVANTEPIYGGPRDDGPRPHPCDGAGAMSIATSSRALARGGGAVGGPGLVGEPLPAIAAASAEITAAAQRAWAAGAAERCRRLLLEVIDMAVEECEELNLATPDGQPPPAAPAEVADLQPTDTVEAHEMLMALRARHMTGSPISAAEEVAWLLGDQVWLAGKREGRW